MLTATAVRLAAVEVLCPTAALAADANYPTLAARNVYDMRAIALQELARDTAYTPTLSLYSGEASDMSRGEASDAYDREGMVTLDIVAELAVAGMDGTDEFADAMAGDDPQADMVLKALLAQVVYRLLHSQTGSLFRRLVKRARTIEYFPFAVPQLGIRYQRVTMRMTCETGIDDFDVPAGRLPEPLNMLYGMLPGGSYAKAKLAELAAHFAPDVLPPLASVHVTTGPVESGPDFEDD